MESHYAAQRLAAIAEIAFCPPSGRSADVVRDTDELEFAAAEVAAAIHVTRRSADRDLGTAFSLKRRLPQVFEALSTGLIDLARARFIDVETCVLDQAAAQSVVPQVLDDASRLTTGQLRARLQRVVMEEAPGASQAKYEEGIEARALVREANPDGTATLIGMQLPPNRAGTAMARINRWAQKLKRSGDPRGMDQIRADVFLDLLNGRQLSDGAGRGVVELRVELTTLAGLDERPGEIAGFGQVSADVAPEDCRVPARFRVAVRGGG
ncbi:MAG: DUF222 domain-containing protein [Acidimicrobiia bacterium]